jgi:hypothetical protein
MMPYSFTSRALDCEQSAQWLSGSVAQWLSDKSLIEKRLRKIASRRGAQASPGLSAQC